MQRTGDWGLGTGDFGDFGAGDGISMTAKGFQAGSLRFAVCDVGFRDDVRVNDKGFGFRAWGLRFGNHVRA